jgi:tRNA threonylcarbamoyladenosine biosynthesis protein TsaE
MRRATRSAGETRALGRALASVLEPGDVVLLEGELGTGKTTLVQGIAAGLGVGDAVTSPTFAIVQEYEGRVGLAHVDVYRLDHVQEVHDLGLEEAIDAGRVVVVEWGAAVVQALPAEHLLVRLEMSGDDDRLVTITAHGRRWLGRAAALDRATAQWVAGEGATA